MRVVFFGSGAFGLPTLRALAQSHEVIAIVSQPDKPAGRGGRLTPTPVSQWAMAHAPSVPLLRPENVNEAAIVGELRAYNADAFVVIAFGQKMGRDLLEGVFSINLHASLLPRWRGAAPINHAILAGDLVTGNSVITLADRMDAGLVLGKSEREITPGLTAGELHDLLSDDGSGLVLQVLDQHARRALTPRTQDESLVTKAGKLSRADAKVDVGRSAFVCARRINGLSPWPGVTVSIGGIQVRLLRAREEPGGAPRAEAGVVTDPREGIVACGDGRDRFRVMDVQPSGGRAMPWADFARGRLALSIARNETVALTPADETP